MLRIQQNHDRIDRQPQAPKRRISRARSRSRECGVLKMRIRQQVPWRRRRRRQLGPKENKPQNFLINVSNFVAFSLPPPTGYSSLSLLHLSPSRRLPLPFYSPLLYACTFPLPVLAFLLPTVAFISAPKTVWKTISLLPSTKMEEEERKVTLRTRTFTQQFKHLSSY